MVDYLAKKYPNMLLDAPPPVLVIPVHGCQGCVKKAIALMNQHAQDGKLITVILTDQPILHQQTFLQGAKSPYVHFEKSIGGLGQVSEFPYLFELKEGELRSARELDSYAIVQELFMLSEQIKGRPYAYPADVYTYLQVEQKPRFQQGDLYKHIGKALAASQADNPEGVFEVGFEIAPDGSVQQAQLLQGWVSCCENQVLEAFRMPAGSWVPGRFRGQTVKTAMAVQVSL